MVIFSWQPVTCDHGDSAPHRIEHTKSQDGPAQEWACSRREWSILYRGSRDGFSARSFHSLCDDKGPTLLIVKVRRCEVGVVTL